MRFASKRVGELLPSAQRFTSHTNPSHDAGRSTSGVSDGWNAQQHNRDNPSTYVNYWDADSPAPPSTINCNNKTAVSLSAISAMDSPIARMTIPPANISTAFPHRFRAHSSEPALTTESSWIFPPKQLLTQVAPSLSRRGESYLSKALSRTPSRSCAASTARTPRSSWRVSPAWSSRTPDPKPYTGSQCQAFFPPLETPLSARTSSSGRTGSATRSPAMNPPRRCTPAIPGTLPARSSWTPCSMDWIASHHCLPAPPNASSRAAATPCATSPHPQLTSSTATPDACRSSTTRASSSFTNHNLAARRAQPWLLMRLRHLPPEPPPTPRLDLPNHPPLRSNCSDAPRPPLAAATSPKTSCSTSTVSFPTRSNKPSRSMPWGGTDRKRRRATSLTAPRGMASPTTTASCSANCCPTALPANRPICGRPSRRSRTRVPSSLLSSATTQASRRSLGRATLR